MKDIRYAATRSIGKVLHTVPEGNRHARCGVVAEHVLHGPTALRSIVDGTHRFCKNCARVKTPRDLNAPAVPIHVTDPATDVWTITNRAGTEVSRVTAPTGVQAQQLVRRNAVAREWIAREGKVNFHRLRVSQL